MIITLKNLLHGTPVLRAGEAEPWILLSGLGHSLQERLWGAGVGPEKDNGAEEGSGAQDLWEAAEEVAPVLTEEN